MLRTVRLHRENQHEFSENGPRVGLHVQTEIGRFGLEPILYAGAFNAAAELDLEEDEVEVEEIRYGRSWGGEVGGGIGIPLVSRLRLVPEVRYRSHEARARSADASVRQLEVEYIGFNLGIVWRF